VLKQPHSTTNRWKDSLAKGEKVPCPRALFGGENVAEKGELGGVLGVHHYKRLTPSVISPRKQEKTEIAE